MFCFSSFARYFNLHIYFKLSIFCWWGPKIYLPSSAGYIP